MTTRPKPTNERRWAVKVSIWHHGRLGENCPFLAGRHYFTVSDKIERPAETYPPTATFSTREQARKRCAMIRDSRWRSWRVAATPVRVTVTTKVTT